MTPAALRALCAAATPGPWEIEVDRNDQPCLYADGRNRRWIAMFPHQCVQSLEVLANADAAYIAALSPDVVLRLLDCVDALAQCIAGYQECQEDMADWASYASEYFQKKHRLADDITRHAAKLEAARAALAKLEER
jgi:hypothetical protein